MTNCHQSPREHHVISRRIYKDFAEALERNAAWTLRTEKRLQFDEIIFQIRATKLKLGDQSLNILNIGPIVFDFLLLLNELSVRVNLESVDYIDFCLGLCCRYS